MAERESNRRKENTAVRACRWRIWSSLQGSYFRKSRRFTKRKKDNGHFRNGKKTKADKNCGRASLRCPAVVYILKRTKRKRSLHPIVRQGHGQDSYFYDADEGMITSVILLVVEFCSLEIRHIFTASLQSYVGRVLT